MTLSYAAFELEYREFVYESYLALDDTPLQYMSNFQIKHGLDPSDPDIIEKTAATLLYLSLGIPARYTVGFLTEVQENNKSTSARALDDHAIITLGTLAPGHRLEIVNETSLELPNSVDKLEIENVISSYTIFDENGTDVTNNYNVTVTHGKLTLIRK